MKKDVYQEMYGNLLKKCKIFERNFSKDCLLELAEKMQEKVVVTEEVLINQEDVPETIYFIISGIMKNVIYINGKEYIIKKYK